MSHEYGARMDSTPPALTPRNGLPGARRSARVLLCLLLAGAALAVPPADAAPPAGAQRPPDVDKLLQKLDDLFRSRSSVSRMEITVTSPRNTRTVRLKGWTSGEERALLVIEAPPREAGIATLRVGDNLWNYLPRIARTIRVPPSMMLGAWMGTDFTNDDLVRESSYRKDFVSRVEGRSEQPAGWRIVSEVKPGVVGRWARIEMIVGDDDLPLEMRYFDRRGRLARTMRFDQVKAMGGRRIPTHLTLEPADAKGQRTEMRYLDVTFDATVPESTFSLQRLEKGE